MNFQNLLTGESTGAFDQLSVRSGGSMQDILTLIAGGGGGGVTGITDVTGSGRILVFASGTTRQISIDLNDYSTTAQVIVAIAAALAGYSTTSQVNASQVAALVPYSTTLQADASLASALVPYITTAQVAANISAAIAYFQSVTLRYNGQATDKALTQNAAGKLLWNGGEVQMAANTFQQFNFVAPMTSSVQGSSLTIESLWMPSTVAPGLGLLSVPNDALGTLGLNVDYTYMGSIFQTPADVALALQAYSTTAIMNNSLSFKQNNLTATLPLQLSGATLSSLWKPSNFTVGAGLVGVSSNNLGTFSLGMTGTESRQALKLLDSNGTVRDLTSSVAGALTWNGAAMATQTQLALKADDSAVTAGFNSVNAELAQKQEALSVVDGLTVSGSTLGCPAISQLSTSATGLSLGSGTGSSQLFSIFEDPSNQNYNYCFGLVELGSAYGAAAVGIGTWSSTGTSTPRQNSASGVLPHTMLSNNGNFGVNVIAPSARLSVGGDAVISGNLSASSKSWDIPNPDPAKPDMRLRHFCTESDDIGGSVQYRRTIDMTSTAQTLEMPSWFQHLVKDVVVMVTPFQHFGSAWGACLGNTITVHATTLGKWHVLVTASRNDDASRSCAQEIEYTPEEAPLPENNP